MPLRLAGKESDTGKESDDRNMNERKAYREKLADEVTGAVVRCIEALLDAHRGETLQAFALCVDDSISSLFHTACTAEAFARSKRDIFATPTDWPYEEGAAEFDTVQEILRGNYETRSKSDGFLEHLEDSFDALVAGLQGARAVGFLSADGLLLVCGSDPGPGMVAREADGVRRLNSSATVVRYEKRT